jgi:hypothetical protein
MNIELDSAVRRRADSRCEYCLVPASADNLPFQIDHIIAKKHAGETVLDNLALSCFQCNVYKGPNIATIDRESNELTRLFNPRRDVWREHFSLLSDGVIVGKTAVGRGTVLVLNMNELGAVQLRFLLMQNGTIDLGMTR